MKKEFHKLKYPIIGITVIFLILISLTSSIFASDLLVPEDFEEESWSKTIDYLDYVDMYAVIHGKPRPPRGAEANLFMTYVNQSGLQMLYTGLSNITMGYGKLAVTLPIQTLMMKYKSETEKEDFVTASSYIMLMAYNESSNTIFEGSPDKSDLLYASFSMGFDLSELLQNDAPALNSKTIQRELVQHDENNWSWGMTYTNLTAIWWNIEISQDNSSYKTIPVAITVYEELTFNYDLILNPESNSAQIISSYEIGKMTDLWVIDDFVWIFPVIVHYNSTGCYRLNNQLYSNETIHQFLNKNNIEMSMVFFQASALLENETESQAYDQDVTENEVIVSDHIITTYTKFGDKLSSVNFGAKDKYTLHNSTSGFSSSYDAIVRTAERQGFAKNPIFKTHTFLMNYIPLTLAHMDETLFEHVRENFLNMTYADYFYIISYPTYDGYTIEHDPILTAYFSPTTEITEQKIILNEIILIVGLITVGVLITLFILIKRRK